MPGDLAPNQGCAFVSCFGVNNKGKNFAEQGARAALEILERAKQAGFTDMTAGVSIGMSFCGVCGNSQRRGFVVLSLEMNVAARLAAQAEPGSALVTQRVCEATENHIKYDAVHLTYVDTSKDRLQAR